MTSEPRWEEVVLRACPWLLLQVRPFSELPQRPVHGMLNFWQTKEGLHAIETDATLRPPPIMLQQDLQQPDSSPEALPEAGTEPIEALSNMQASAVPVMIEAGA